jgi:cell division protein FtsW (lipid II flippase)
LVVLAAGFVFASAIALSLVEEKRILWQHLYAPTVWLIAVFVALGFLQRYSAGHDPILFPVVSLMSGWGLVLLDRLAPNFLERQVIWLLLATVVIVLVAILPWNLRLLRRYRYTWLLVGLVLLLATLIFGVNPSGQGAALWLKVPLLGPVYFQPSELMKLLLVVFLASYFDERRLFVRREGNSRFGATLAYLAPLLLMWGFSLVVLIWQRDLGTATLFLIVFLALLYLASGNWRYVVGGLVLLLIAGVVGYFAFDVVALRIDTWMNPWLEADSRGFQIVQALYAVASGGLLGQGIGQGSPTFIPVVHSDFAFAAIVEEWGLLGGTTIVICFALIAFRGLRIAGTSSRSFHFYLAAGIVTVLTVQAFLILGGITKLLPLTGVTLPFVSYGGSSLIVSSVMIGLLLNMSSPGQAGVGRRALRQG